MFWVKKRDFISSYMHFYVYLILLINCKFISIDRLRTINLTDTLNHGIYLIH